MKKQNYIRLTVLLVLLIGTLVSFLWNVITIPQRSEAILDPIVAGGICSCGCVNEFAVPLCSFPLIFGKCLSYAYPNYFDKILCQAIENNDYFPRCDGWDTTLNTRIKGYFSCDWHGI